MHEAAQELDDLANGVVQQQPSFLDISWSVPQCLNYCSDYFHLMI
jgi:2-keto-4-pentenoate hydratase/2-oxohepta-3-ene-1,7-dioic acid hydratase in catechol pathway